MTDSSLLRGSIVALLTPMTADEKIDFPHSNGSSICMWTRARARSWLRRQQGKGQRSRSKPTRILSRRSGSRTGSDG